MKEIKAYELSHHEVETLAVNGAFRNTLNDYLSERFFNEQGLELPEKVDKVVYKDISTVCGYEVKTSKRLSELTQIVPVLVIKARFTVFVGNEDKNHMVKMVIKDWETAHWLDDIYGDIKFGLEDELGQRFKEREFDEYEFVKGLEITREGQYGQN